MIGRGVLHDGEAQASTAALARPARVDAIEALEDLGLRRLGDTQAGICHDEARASVNDVDAGVDRTTGAVVADRVVAQVVGKLVEK